MRICMLAYSFFETDGRVLMYTDALSERGDQVDVIALAREGQPNHENVNGINVYRIQKRIINEKGVFSYLIRLLFFFVKSFILLAKRHMVSPYHLIHVHSVPDFEVFAGLIPKLLGAKIILDIHDIVPEFYAGKFQKGHNSLIFKLLVLLEKLSIMFSDYVIIANDLWKKTLASRSVRSDKCKVILNYPDLAKFQKTPKIRSRKKFIMIFPGSLNWHQGIDIAVKAFIKVLKNIPLAEFHIYGDGAERKSILSLIRKLGLEENVLVKKNVPLSELPEIISNADLGVVPKRANSFGNEAFSTKILEFMAVGIPVVVSATKIDKYYFNESIVKFFEPEDENDLAEAILLLAKDKKLKVKLTSNAQRFIEKNGWDIKKHIYLDLVDSLVGSKRSCV